MAGVATDVLRADLCLSDRGTFGSHSAGHLAEIDKWQARRPRWSRQMEQLDREPEQLAVETWEYQCRLEAQLELAETDA